jgi:HD domain
MIARDLLAGPLPRRWAHTRGVAATARAIASAYGPDAPTLEAAAWLHDIGYTPALADHGTGFHPLDGARHLRDTEQADELTCRLVAHHSCAHAAAAGLGLADELTAEFPAPPAPLADALTYCDMTTGPDGQPMTITGRLAEITDRYGPGHMVTRAVTASAPDITAAANRTTARLNARTSKTPRSAENAGAGGWRQSAGSGPPCAD